MAPLVRERSWMVASLAPGMATSIGQKLELRRRPSWREFRLSTSGSRIGAFWSTPNPILLESEPNRLLLFPARPADNPSRLKLISRTKHQASNVTMFKIPLWMACWHIITMNSSDEFYIGWQGQAPKAIGSHVRKTVIGLLLLALVLGVLFVLAQRTIGKAAFE